MYQGCDSFIDPLSFGFRVCLLALICYVNLCICHFPMWYPWSGVVLNCIDCWFLPILLLCDIVTFVSLLSPAGNGLTSWLSYVWCFLGFSSPYRMVSWVSCSTSLYPFMIFAFFFALVELTMAELELFFSFDCLWIMGPRFCKIIVW